MDMVTNDNFFDKVEVPKTELVGAAKAGLLGALPPQVQEEREKEAIVIFLQKQGIDCKKEEIEKRQLIINGNLKEGYAIVSKGYCFTTRTIHNPNAPKVGPRQFEVEMHLLPPMENS